MGEIITLRIVALDIQHMNSTEMSALNQPIDVNHKLINSLPLSTKVRELLPKFDQLIINADDKITGPRVY